MTGYTPLALIDGHPHELDLTRCNTCAAIIQTTDEPHHDQWHRTLTTTKDGQRTVHAHTPEFLTQVAHVYNTDTTGAPRRAVANHFERDTAAVGVWIRKARLAGLIPPFDNPTR